MYVDFHTHKIKPAIQEEVISVYCHTNLTESLPPIFNAARDKLCFGLHPWFLPESVEKGIELLNNFKKGLSLSAIGFGECGLDRLKGPDLAIQLEFLEKQLDWCQEFPFVVFHCVRAFPELISLLKKNSYQGNIVFHDYRGNKDITFQLLKNPKIYFSLGSLLFSSHDYSETLKMIPLERVFLETDDSDKTIQEVYECYRSAMGLEIAKVAEIAEINDIKDQLYQNFQKIQSTHKG